MIIIMYKYSKGNKLIDWTKNTFGEYLNSINLIIIIVYTIKTSIRNASKI
jgi:hypothetical protein